jgi:hypothetical protein
MIRKAIVCSLFFTIGLTVICFGKGESAAVKVETIEKGVTLYELEETGQQFFICGKGKTVVFIPDGEPTGMLMPSESPIEPSSEEPTEEEPTDEPQIIDRPIHVFNQQY